MSRPIWASRIRKARVINPHDKSPIFAFAVAVALFSTPAFALTNADQTALKQLTKEYASTAGLIPPAGVWSLQMPGGFRWTFTRLPRGAASPNVFYQVAYPGNNAPSPVVLRKCSKRRQEQLKSIRKMNLIVSKDMQILSVWKVGLSKRDYASSNHLRAASASA